MKLFKSVQIDDFHLNLEKLGDLVYHEGPLLSLFKDRENLDAFYLYKWADSNEVSNRWLVFPVNKRMLIGFFQNEFTLRQLIEKQAFVHLIDIHDDLKTVQSSLALTKDLPSVYLPSTNSHFDPENYTSFAENFKSDLLAEEFSGVLATLSHKIQEIRNSQQSSSQQIQHLQNLVKAMSSKLEHGAVAEPLPIYSKAKVGDKELLIMPEIPVSKKEIPSE